MAKVSKQLQWAKEYVEEYKARIERGEYMGRNVDLYNLAKAIIEDSEVDDDKNMQTL